MENISVEGPHNLWPTAAGCIGFLLVLTYVFASFTKSSTTGRLPPGPKPKPLIGNLLDMPPPGAPVEKYWTSHRELYGDISYMNVLGSGFLVINCPKIAKDLLEKRSAIYSNRPVMQMASKLVGLDQGMVLTQPGPRFRELRRVAHNQIGSITRVARWKNDIDIEVRRYLLRTLERPQDFLQHIRTEAGSIILKITYGYQVNPHGRDTLVDLAEHVMNDFFEYSVPGAFLVDVMPILRHIPAWFPGAGFKKSANIWAERLERHTQLPYSFVQKNISNDTAALSLVSESIKKHQSDMTPEQEDVIKWAGSSMYGGGADTTVAQMEMFYLAMLLYPDVLRKAQGEIDRVIGSSRLPDENDRQNLPYVDALLKESMRWEPIGEILIPHSTAEDDTFEGYHIPKDTMIIANVYGFLHDPKMYSNPMEFKPERFLGDSPEPSPFDIMWGYGRRVCPGRHLATWNLWLQMSRTLAVFDIKPFADEPPKREFTAGTVRRPLPFKADIRPRSEKHAILVRSVLDDAPFPENGDAEFLDAN